MAKWSLTLTELVHTRGAALHRYGFFLCGSRSDAADLVQEALVRVFAKPRTSWDLGSVEGYVRTAMLHNFLDIQRRSARLAALTSKCAKEEFFESSEAVNVKIDLLAALRNLSARQRACIVLRYYEDNSIAQIASTLGCAEGTVKRHLSDALKTLNFRYGENLKEETL